MRRRFFLCWLAGIAAWPVAAYAEQTPAPIIGFLHPASPEAYAKHIGAFRQGLGETGYIEGKNVLIEYRWAQNHNDRLPALAADLVGRQVAVLATGSSTAAAIAAKRATATIPIVFTIGGDPVRFGLVASLNRPGGNVTGVTFRSNLLVTKQLELLRDLAPTASTIGLLVNPTNPNTESDIKAAQGAARTLGRQLHVVSASTDHELAEALASLVQDHVAALLVVPDAFFSTRAKRIVAFAAHRTVPAIYSNRGYAAVGGLMSYGADPVEAYHQAGVYAGRILKGAKPSELPIEQSTKFELIINLRAAKTLGLSIPQSLLLRANELIQ